MEKREITKAMKDAWVQHLLSKFLLITFTDAAAAEMRTRLAGAFLTEGYEIDPEKIPTMTFNSFAMDLVKEFYNDLGFLKTPIVVDTNPTREAMGILPLITRDKVDGLNYNVAVESQYGALTIAIKVFKLIKSSRIDFSQPGATEEFANKFLRPANLYKYMSDQSIEQLVDLYQEYEQILTSQGLLTFADQEPMALSVLDMHPDQLAKFGFEHIVVDEFQDSSDIQMEFIKLFADCPTVKDIMVIGDDNQSIYGFRNANPDNMIHFQEKLGKPVTSLLMTQNYRSYEEIIDLANKLVALNVNRIDKPLVAAKGAGGAVSVRGFYNEPDEQKYVADNIKKLLEDGYKPEDIAIITFSKKELMKFAAAFSKEGIPWVMMAPVKVIENSRVLAAMSLADAFYEPEATQSYFNYLVAKYDGKILEELTDDEINKEIEELRSTFSGIDNAAFNFQQKTFHDMLEALDPEKVDEIYQKWLEQVYENEDLPSELQFIQNFKRFGKNTELKMDQKYEGVALTTAHSSKGLEWKVIFNSISSYDSKRYLYGRHQDEVEEKRRLLFVSMTRAKEKLFVTGQYKFCTDEKNGDIYNRFLKELYEIVDPELKSYVPVDPMKAIREEERRQERNRKAREKRAAQKATQAVDDDSNIDMKAKSRPMTAKEKAEYEALVKNSVQATLFS